MSDSAQTATRSRRSAGGLAGEQAVGPAHQGRREAGHARQRQAEQLRTLDQRVEIALGLGQLRVEPALAQAERGEHDPLRRQALDHAIQHQRRRRQGARAAGGHPGQGRELGFGDRCQSFLANARASAASSV